ncbi:MAG TPA: MBL fold metallo-hydrolase [Candidatus Angelobacter sp.]|jgi:L-ascorbate 6-phosphate lactonase|nr:MBL fold metallo-hydrolase [Candidatus Angelobacter sp.]
MAHECMEAIRQFKVDRGSAALWWLGQMGFLVKTHEGTLISVDAYLSNSCAKIGESLGLNFNRKVPIFIPPDSLDVDYYLCTHSHYDHADPETIEQVPKDRVNLFVGPGLVCETFSRCGVEGTKIRQIYPGGKIQIADVAVHGTFAMPTDDSDLNHMGFVLAIQNGPRIYISGDTDYTNLLGHVAKLEPDVMITCMNGGFNNLSHWEAAEVASMLKPKVAIPCHYDMFPENSTDPEQFRAGLRYKAPQVRYKRLDYVKPFVFKS